jgi:hypothetical protein
MQDITMRFCVVPSPGACSSLSQDLSDDVTPHGKLLVGPHWPMRTRLEEKDQ